MVDYPAKIKELNGESFDMIKALVLLHKMRLNIAITNDKELLKLACKFSKYCYNKNSLDTRILLYKIYFESLYDDQDLIETAKILKVINSGLKYYKANDFNLFLQIMYVKSKFSNNEKQIQKTIKVFEEYIDEYSISDVFIADFIIDKSPDKAYDGLKNAVKKGNKSTLLFECLYKYYSNYLCDSKDIKILNSVIKWAYRNDFSIQNIVEMQISTLCICAAQDVKLTQFLYEYSQNDELLKSICKLYIYRNDMSAKAFSYYKLAVQKQLYVDRLNKVFIMSAYYNNYENISNYHMKTYLINNSIPSDIEAFIYHVILTNSQLIEFIDVLIENVITLVKKIIVEKTVFEDKELTVLKYAMLNYTKLNLTKEELKTISEIVFNNLFLYKLNIPYNNFQKIVIIDKNKATTDSYTIEKNEAVIKSSTAEFSYYLFDDNKKNIEVKNISIKPFIVSLDVDIYLYFYENGYYSDELFIFLTNYFFDQPNSSEYIDVFNKTNEIQNLNEEFKKRINTYLARINILNNDYKKALDNITLLSYKDISSAFLEKIIEVYLSNQKYQEVKNIVIENFNKLSSETFIKISSSITDTTVLESFSGIFYRAFKNGIDDDVLFKNVITYGNISFDDQLKYYERCKAIGYYDEKFLISLLENALDKRIIDSHIESLFIDYFAQTINNVIFRNFTEFMLYKVIKDDYNLSIKTIEFFEEVGHRNISVYYLLFIYYNNNGTDNIDAFNDILSVLEKNELIFVTKEKMKNHYGKHSFFRKYKAFRYDATVDKTVYLHYKIDNKDYCRVKMRYYKYDCFLAKVLLFYGEKIEYYFEEVSNGGSIVTKSVKFVNKDVNITDDIDDRFDVINNTLILQSKYLLSECEKNIEYIFDIEEIDFNKIK